MKKLFTFFLMTCAVLMVQAQSEFSVNYVSPIDEDEVEIGADSHCLITEIDAMTGMMECKGYIANADTMMVTVTRSVAGKDDELCAAGNCVPGNKALTQVFHFDKISIQNNQWYAHYEPEATDLSAYTVTYLFKSGTVERKLTVEFAPARTALSDVAAQQKTKPGVYTILGQQLRKTGDIDGLPAGMYVVNGKKVIIK